LLVMPERCVCFDLRQEYSRWIHERMTSMADVAAVYVDGGLYLSNH